MRVLSKVDLGVLITVLFNIIAAIGLPFELEPTTLYTLRVGGLIVFVLALAGSAIVHLDWLKRLRATRGFNSMLAYLAVAAFGALVASAIYALTKPATHTPSQVTSTDRLSPTGRIEYFYAYQLTESQTTAIRTAFFLQVTVTNHGSPTTLDGWRLHFHSHQRDVLDIPYEPFPSELTLRDLAENKTIVFKGDESLAEKAMSLIATGERRRGWLLFLVPLALDIDGEVFDARTTLKLSFLDSRDKKFVADTLSNPTKKAPAYFPGTRQPTITSQPVSPQLVPQPPAKVAPQGDEPRGPRTTERSWVTVIGVSFRNLFETDAPLGGEVIFKNTGTIPATNVRSLHNVGIGELPEDMPQGTPANRRSVGVLTPGGEFLGSLDHPRKRTSQDVADFERGKTQVYMFGRITYTDANGTKGETSFCFEADRQGGEASVCDRWNSAQ